jgi:hypothetical protein
MQLFTKRSFFFHNPKKLQKNFFGNDFNYLRDFARFFFTYNVKGPKSAMIPTTYKLFALLT